MNDAPVRRRWFRFSLRMLLAVVTVLCVWLAFKVNAARRQKEAVAAILKAGGSIGYDYQTVLVSGHPDWFSVEDHKLPSWPIWLSKMFGKDYLSDIWVASFYNLPRSISESDFAQLSKLPTLRFMYLTNLKIASSDADRYRRLRDKDLEVLIGLRNLRYLNIIGAEFSAAGIRELKESLPNIVIVGPLDR
jgi:hypothetical protein